MTGYCGCCSITLKVPCACSGHHGGHHRQQGTPRGDGEATACDGTARCSGRVRCPHDGAPRAPPLAHGRQATHLGGLIVVRGLRPRHFCRREEPSGRTAREGLARAGGAHTGQDCLPSRPRGAQLSGSARCSCWWNVCVGRSGASLVQEQAVLGHTAPEAGRRVWSTGPLQQ